MPQSQLPRGKAAAPPALAQLEQAALHILRLIRDTPGLANTKLAVIGDLAVCKYLPDIRRPESIDFVVSKSSSPGRVRKEIVGHPMSPLIETAGAVFYRHSTGWEVEVKLSPDWVCPYLPAAARPVRDDIESLPYISLEDLIVFKADACGMRETDASRRREATEAAALLALASKHTALIITDQDKLERIEQALEDVVEFCEPGHDKSWWQRQLGLKTPLDRQRSAQEIVSEIADHTFSSPTTPTSSVYSSMSRTSSYTSSVSTHSTSSSVSSLVQSPEPKTPRPRKLSVTSTSKSPRHKRHTSNTSNLPKATLEVAMQHMSLERPASPGMALTNRI